MYVFICLLINSFIWVMVSLCTSDYSGTHYIDQNDLELTEINLGVKTEAALLTYFYFKNNNLYSLEVLYIS